MHSLRSVGSAIQALSGVYVYDYAPNDELSRRINIEFSNAEQRLDELLRSPEFRAQHADELITLAVLLSMQDVCIAHHCAQMLCISDV
jgi:hypothetical protein